MSHLTVQTEINNGKAVFLSLTLNGVSTRSISRSTQSRKQVLTAMVFISRWTGTSRVMLTMRGLTTSNSVSGERLGRNSRGLQGLATASRPCGSQNSAVQSDGLQL